MLPLEPPRPAKISSTIPALRERLIGREAERSVLLHQLSAPDRRLITLVGPGGIGKTSLALDIASAVVMDHAAPFVDGAAVTFLAAVVTAADVPLAIAETLAYRLQGARPIADQLIKDLQARSLLLVLDNVEHLLNGDEAATFSELLGRLISEAPNVRILVTSRERLRLRDEWVVELAGLALPSSDSALQVERAAAVRLFVERARQHDPAFKLTAENRAAAATICRQLEGMPLAIELAASWVRVLSPAEITTEIDRALDFLLLTSRDIPPRHRSIRAALNPSWSMLRDDERRVLARLSVFRGGCDREAAVAITGATLLTITSLIDKSLVRREQTAGGTRYTLHELVRQYAAERLAAEPDDQAATEARHTSYYASMLQRSISPQTGASTPEARALLDQNMDNLRGAWTRAADAGSVTAIAMMTRGLRILYDDHGWLRDGAALFGRAADGLHAAGVAGVAVRGYVLGAQAYFLLRVGAFEAARPLLEQGLALVQSTGSTEGLANLTYSLAHTAFHLGQLTEALELWHSAAQLAAESGDHFLRLWSELWLGLVAMCNGEYDAAEPYFAGFYQGWRGQGYSRGEAIGLVTLGGLFRRMGRLDEATAYLHEGLRIGSAASDQLTIGVGLNELGSVALARGELDEARYLTTECVAIMREMGDGWHRGLGLRVLVHIEYARGDYAAAWHTCAELARLALSGEAVLRVDARYGFALLLDREGRREEALALVNAPDDATGDFDTIQRIDTLRADLERHVEPTRRTSAANPAATRPLESWLRELAARTFTGVPVPIPTAQPVPLPGSLYVAETGETLSPREIEVLRLLIAGASNQAIADTLVINLYTAKHHVASILQKLGTSTRTQAALRGRALGLEPLALQ